MPWAIGAIILLAAGFFGSPLGAGEVSSHLPEEIFPELKRILRESPTRSWRMLEEDLQVAEARAQAEVHSSGLYPSVSGSYRYLYRAEERQDFDGTRDDFLPQARLTVRQPLYHWGGLRANDRLGRIRRAMAVDSRAEVYRLLALEIRSSFLDLAIHQEAIDLAEAKLELAEQERRVAEVRFAREEITSEERTEARLAAEEAALNLERLRREREFLVDEFARLAGVEENAGEWAPAEIPALPDTGGVDRRTVAIGKIRRPGRDHSRGRVRQAEEQVEVERARNRPRVDLIAGVVQDQVAVFDQSDINRTMLFAGVEVTWNIFDGFEGRGRRGAALARRRLEEKRHERQEREWAASLEQLEAGVGWSARELEIAEERRELAERNLSQKREDFERGRISETEMARIRVAARERELALTQSRADYLMTVAEYVSEAGADPLVRPLQYRTETTK